jgi:hypothetical protein
MNNHEPHVHGGYEKTDAPAGATYRAGLYILGTMVLTALAVVPMYRFLGRAEVRTQEPAATALRPDSAPAAGSFPKLLESEPAFLAAFRAQEAALLTTYGWVEKDRGIARIPVEEAMRLVAEHGLPTFPAAEPSPGPAGGAR